MIDDVEGRVMETRRESDGRKEGVMEGRSDGRKEGE